MYRERISRPRTDRVRSASFRSQLGSSLLRVSSPTMPPRTSRSQRTDSGVGTSTFYRARGPAVQSRGIVQTLQSCCPLDPPTTLELREPLLELCRVDPARVLLPLGGAHLWPRDVTGLGVVLVRVVGQVRVTGEDRFDAIDNKRQRQVADAKTTRRRQKDALYASPEAVERRDPTPTFLDRKRPSTCQNIRLPAGGVGFEPTSELPR
jgi:hypothetical protein